MTPEPVVRKNRLVSPIWILPFIALCISSWLLYSSYRNAGVEITITFDDATGITPGKTQVMARGIPIGQVKEIRPDLDNKQVTVIVSIEQQVEKHLVEDTLFWVVRPELSASSVQGLGTILSGNYIDTQIGTSDIPRRDFVGLNGAPPIPPETPGLHIRLKAETLGSIQVGSGIYYRNIEIGKVQSHRLEGDDNVLINIFIEPKFAHLVKEGSRFCNASGVQISGKLPNFSVKFESLASLLRGGILLYTPDQFHNTPEVANGHIFPLYPDFESAHYGIPMTLNLASGDNIVEGVTKVMYRGLEAGLVKEIEINNDERRTVTAHILLDPRAEIILREGTKFWLVKPEISPSGIHNLGLLLSGAHITFQLGGGSFKNHFDILPSPPPQIPLRPGKMFALQSDDPAHVSSGSPVYFKNIMVGKVVDVDLEHTTEKVRITFYIYQEYLHLLSTKSIFWNQSGIDVEANFTDGVSLSAGPLASVLQGGINFITPATAAGREDLHPKAAHVFHLYHSYHEAVSAAPTLQPAGHRFLIKAGNVASLSVGAPILHKNMKTGEIEGFRFSADQENVLIECVVYEPYAILVKRTSKFYNTSGLQFSAGLDGLNVQTGSMQSIMAGGIGFINVDDGESTADGTPYVLYASMADALNSGEVELTVYLDATKGLRVGSPVRHQGITVGQVTRLRFADDLQTIICTAHVNRTVAPLFREHTLVWVEQAEFGLSGIKNLETLVSGSYLNFLPGDGPFSRIFSARSTPPQTEIANRDGLGIVLEARHLRSLSSGSPIYYRQVQVGRVTGFELSPSFQKVFIFASVENRYRALIRRNTKFWDVSGTKIEGGIFSGLTISIESLKAVLQGGIALATPDGSQSGTAVGDGHHFTLHDKAEKQWLDWSPDIILLEREQEARLPSGDR
ncbi:MAG: MlaD family protein [Desulforhopalus sp.]